MNLRRAGRLREEQRDISGADEVFHLLFKFTSTTAEENDDPSVAKRTNRPNNAGSCHLRHLDVTDDEVKPRRVLFEFLQSHLSRRAGGDVDVELRLHHPRHGAENHRFVIDPEDPQIVCFQSHRNSVLCKARTATAQHIMMCIYCQFLY